MKIVPAWGLFAALLFWPAAAASQQESSKRGDGFPAEKDGSEGEEEEGGEEDEFKLLEEELSAEVVVSASKHRESIFWSPSAISVFTRKEIRASGANDIPDLLRRVPNSDVYRVKPGYPLVGMRSLTDEANNLVLLLVDGREDMAEITGFAFWNGLTFDQEEIERIEIIRGPGSALYGANAFAAVVSVTTVSNKDIRGVQFFAGGGEYGHYRLFGRVRDYTTLGKGTLSYSLGFGRQEMLMPSDRDDLAMGEFRSHGVVRYRAGKNLDLSLHGGVTFGAHGTFFVHIGDLVLTNALTYFVMGKGELALADNLKLKAQLYHVAYSCDFHYRATLSAYNVWVANVPPLFVFFPTVDSQVQLDWQIRDDLLVIGGTNLRLTGVEGKNTVFSSDQEIRGAGFVHLEWKPWELFQLTGGMRFDANNYKNSQPALSPRVVAVFRPWPEHAFRLGFGIAFRKPSVFESQSHIAIQEYNQATPEAIEFGATQFGNPELQNEKVYTLETGWRAELLDQRLRLSLDLFYSLYRDTIGFVIQIRKSPFGFPLIPGSKARYENAGDEVNSLGGEAEVVWNPDREWRLFGNVGLRHVTDRQTGDRLASEPRLRVNLGAGYIPANGLLFDVALHFVSGYRMPQLDPLNILNDPTHATLGDAFTLIGRLAYRFVRGETSCLEAGITVHAPLGGAIREYPGVRMPFQIRRDTLSDFGGIEVRRLLSFYLRGELY